MWPSSEGINKEGGVWFNDTDIQYLIDGNFGRKEKMERHWKDDPLKKEQKRLCIRSQGTPKAPTKVGAAITMFP